jgi:Sec-independent protein secretion pathway component TatC
MAVPLMGLYEIGIFVARFAEKKRLKVKEEEAGEMQEDI